MDAWIACKEGVVHGELQNDKIFSIRGKRSLPNVPTLSHLQMKRCGRKCHQVFLIHLSEVENETKDNESNTKGVKVSLNDFEDILHGELNELPPIREVDHAISSSMMRARLGSLAADLGPTLYGLKLSLQALSTHILVLSDIKYSNN